MLFTSGNFLVFLFLAFLGYWLIQNARMQNAFLLFVSVIFYSMFDWRMCLLLMGSIVVVWGVGVLCEKFLTIKRVVLYINIVILLSLLGVFKYFNFFSESISRVLSAIGFNSDPILISIVMPVGISFWVFMEVGYLLDIKNNKIKAETSFLKFATFMSFFPQLAAGPIGRADEMLPQYANARKFNDDIAADGLRQFFWGAFKKIAIADVSSGLVDRIFLDYGNLSGSILMLGAVLFSVQIYADFSGYSDMAIGVGKLFGIRLRRNFAYPYFATNIADFWRRWHMSLTTWFRDYLYIPLGGSRCGKMRHISNTMGVFLVSGLWHGANWTYVVWGFVHGLLFVPRIISDGGTKKNIKARRVCFGILSWLCTIIPVILAWVFFRAPSISVGVDYLSHMFTRSLFSVPNMYLSALPLTVFMFLVEWIHRNEEHGLTLFFVHKRSLRWVIYFVLVFVLFSQHQRSSEFIYFQF